jgi:hypothetical protein
MTKTQLDLMVASGCQGEGCTHDTHEEGVWLHGRCHPSAGVSVHYLNGVLTVSCFRCHKAIAAIAVADAVSRS